MDDPGELSVAVTVDERWCIAGRPHGGYLLREMVRPLLTTAHPHPLAVSAHFLRSPQPGPARVQTEVLRRGRTVTSARTRLVQRRPAPAEGAGEVPAGQVPAGQVPAGQVPAGQVMVEALVTSGALDPAAEPFWTRGAVPQLAPPERCVRSRSDVTPGVRIGHLDFVDIRWEHPPASSPAQSQARFTTWMRLAGAEATPLDLLVLGDALPPMTLDMGMPGWAPTVELTVLVRGVPAPGWLVAEQRAELLEGGWMDESLTLWDSRGRLVCQARQLAGYRLPA